MEPPFEEKARAIALRMVRDFGGDAEARELWTRTCWEAAREEYEKPAESVPTNRDH